MKKENSVNVEKAVTVLNDKIQVHSAFLDDIKDAVIDNQSALLEHMKNEGKISAKEFSIINDFLKCSGENNRITFSDIFIEK